MAEVEDRPQGDTPPQEPAAPEGDTRTFAGKYKSVEDLEKGYEESQRLISEQGDRVKRLESLILTPSPVEPYPTPQAWQAPAPQTDTVGLPSDFISRAEAEQISDNKLREWQSRQERQQQLSSEQQYWKDEFFRRNTNLREYEDLVRGITPDVIKDYAFVLADPARARGAMPLVLDEIAKRTHVRLADLRKSVKDEAERAAQARADAQMPGSQGPASPPSPAKQQTYEESVQEALRAEQERYTAGRRPPR